jgi:hypothetical protein
MLKIPSLVAVLGLLLGCSSSYPLLIEVDESHNRFRLSELGDDPTFHLDIRVTNQTDTLQTYCIWPEGLFDNFVIDPPSSPFWVTVGHANVPPQVLAPGESYAVRVPLLQKRGVIGLYRFRVGFLPWCSHALERAQEPLAKRRGLDPSAACADQVSWSNEVVVRVDH